MNLSPDNIDTKNEKGAEKIFGSPLAILMNNYIQSVHE